MNKKSGSLFMAIWEP